MIVRILRLTFFCGIVLSPHLWSQSPPDPSEDKPKDAYIKIVNGCDTSQQERWKTGLDLKFKDSYIGRDIRTGERGPVARISFTGRDSIDVYRHEDSSAPVARIPARLEAGGFYTLVVLGQIESNSVNANVLVSADYPIPPASERPGLCRVFFINAISAYPISVSIGKDPARVLPYGEKVELFFPPGELDLGIWFKDATGETRRMQAGMIVEGSGNYTVVIHPSAERSDRPSMFLSNAAEDRTRLKEMNDTPSGSSSE